MEPNDMEVLIRANPPEVCSVVETSILLGITDKAVRNLVHSGALPHTRGKYRELRIRLEDIRAYEDQNAQPHENR